MQCVHSLPGLRPASEEGDSRTVWPCRQEERFCRNSPGASPPQGALPSLPSRLGSRPPPELLAFALFQRQKAGPEGRTFSPRTYMFGVCARGGRSPERTWGVGCARATGSSEGPRKPAGEQVMRIIAGLTRMVAQR